MLSYFDQGANHCDECRNAQDGPFCVAKCPDSKYRDENGVCQYCHQNCAVGGGCTGPRNNVGEGACNSCALVKLDDANSNETRCLPPDSTCEDGYFKHSYPKLPGSQVGWHVKLAPQFCISFLHFSTVQVCDCSQRRVVQTEFTALLCCYRVFILNALVQSRDWKASL